MSRIVCMLTYIPNQNGVHVNLYTKLKWCPCVCVCDRYNSSRVHFSRAFFLTLVGGFSELLVMFRSVDNTLCRWVTSPHPHNPTTRSALHQSPCRTLTRHKAGPEEANKRRCSRTIIPAAYSILILTANRVC